MKEIELRNAVVVITAASDDGGVAVAEAFARRGATLVLAGRDVYGLKMLSARCRELGSDALAVDGDIGDTASARKLVNAARGFGGRIDVWISRPEQKAGHRASDLSAVIPVFLKQNRGLFINMTEAPLPATVRAPLSARRDICLCDFQAGMGLDPDRLAARIVDLVRTPRALATFGANDDVVAKALKAGAAFGMAALAGIGSITTAMQAVRLG